MENDVIFSKKLSQEIENLNIKNDLKFVLDSENTIQELLKKDSLSPVLKESINLKLEKLKEVVSSIIKINKMHISNSTKIDKNGKTKKGKAEKIKELIQKSNIKLILDSINTEIKHVEITIDNKNEEIINQLNKKISTYESALIVLDSENKSLSTRNGTLTAENESLNKIIETLGNENKELRELDRNSNDIPVKKDSENISLFSNKANKAKIKKINDGKKILSRSYKKNYNKKKMRLFNLSKKEITTPTSNEKKGIFKFIINGLNNVVNKLTFLNKLSKLNTLTIAELNTLLPVLKDLALNSKNLKSRINYSNLHVLCLQAISYKEEHQHISH